LSDWGAEQLTEAQVAYAADDVLNLHALRTSSTPCWRAKPATELAAAASSSFPSAPDWTSRLGRGGYFRSFLSDFTAPSRRADATSQAIFRPGRRMIRPMRGADSDVERRKGMSR